MKYELNVQLIACGKKLLEEVAEDIKNHVDDDANFTKTFDDGGYVKCTTDVQIVGRNVTIHVIYEGSGATYEEKMEEMKLQVQSREFQNSFRKDYDRYGPDGACSRIVATVKQFE